MNLKIAKYLQCMFDTIIIVSLPIVIIFSVTLFYAYNHDFYMNEFYEYQLDEYVEISMDDMSMVSEELITFIKGKRTSLAGISVTINGETLPFFNEREMKHMDDVVILFNNVNMIRNGLFIILLVYGVSQWGSVKTRRKALVNYGIGSIFSLLFCGLIIGVSYLDFSKYFTFFHKTFFANDLWLLNPKTDLLIRMLPLEFFTDIVTQILIWSVFISVIIGAVSFILRYRVNNE